MKFSYECPPIYERLHKQFGVEWEDGVVIAYGDTIHCVRPLTPDLWVRENVHGEQQKVMGPEAWWERYLIDTRFRYEQEVQAYREQMKFLKVAVKDRNQRFSIKHRLALDLSGPMYGKLCTYAEAMFILS